MHMPEMDGLTLARQIKDKHAHLPLLMLTSLSDTGTALTERGLFAGVLSKPVRSAELESNIARALGESGRGAASAARRSELDRDRRPRAAALADRRRQSDQSRGAARNSAQSGLRSRRREQRTARRRGLDSATFIR